MNLKFLATMLAPMIVASTALFSMPAQATAFTITPATGTNPFGAPKWRQSVKVTLDGDTRRVLAGLFRLEVDDGAGNKFDKGLRLPGTYTHQAFDPGTVDAVNALWSNAFNLVTDSKTAAAFQFSLWEIVHDTDMDISTGALQLDGKNSTEALAQGWLDNLSDKTWKANPLAAISRYQSDKSQDLLVADLSPDIGRPLSRYPRQ